MLALRVWTFTFAYFDRKQGRQFYVLPHVTDCARAEYY
jgi:hypothetical protein